MTQPATTDAAGLAALSTGLAPSYPTIMFGIGVTFIWGFVWAGVMRDQENQPLPSSFAAKLFFALSLSVLYLGLVIGGFLAPEVLQNLKFLGLNDLPENIIRQIPLFAIIFMGALYSLPQVKDIAQRYAILLHNAQYRYSDEIVLQRHLQTCAFAPSQDELSSNIDYIRQFDVYITDRDHASLKLDAVSAWRKVASLLRLLEDECRASNSVLSGAEREEVARLAEAHRRKTQLAMNIVRMVEHLDAHQNSDQNIKQIAAQLGNVSHLDRERVVSSEELAREILVQLELSGTSDGPQTPLRLSMKQMNEHLGKIERYFLTEYQLLLENAAKLASKAIIRAGDRAPERLAEVKKIGFTGLGEIQRVNFDNVIYVLMTTFALAFGGLTLLFTVLARPVNTSLISSIALTVSLAALIGAMWGSRRSLVERQKTPWSSYIAAGLVGVLGFCIVHGTRFIMNGRETLERLAERFTQNLSTYVDLGLIKSEQVTQYTREAVLDWGIISYMWEILPWSVSVFFLTVGICWLARMPEWPWAKKNRLYERLSDGAFTGLIYALGGIAATLAHIALNTGSGLATQARILQDTGAAVDVFFSSFRMMSFVIGFAIGAIIIREVRQIAHTQLIAGNEQDSAREPARPDFTPVGTQVAVAETAPATSQALARTD